MRLAKAELRQLRPDDAERGAALSQQIGWSHTADTWANLIRWGGEGSFCITQGDELLATTIGFYHSPAIAWVGVVITHPEHQRQGLARRLMTTALDYLREQGAGCIMLDATEQGRPLYESLGFRPVYKVEVFGGVAADLSGTSDARDATGTDIAGIIELDGRVFGAERPPIIRDLAVPGQTWVCGAPGVVDGYLMAKVSNYGINIGPWYHTSAEGAESLFRRAALFANGQPLRVYIPEANSDAKRIIERYGLTPVRYTTRMALGDKPPGEMGRQYSIASFATG